MFKRAHALISAQQQPWLWLANQMKARSTDSQTVTITTRRVQSRIASFKSVRLELKMPKQKRSSTLKVELAQRLSYYTASAPLM